MNHKKCVQSYVPSGVGEAPLTFACEGGKHVLLQPTQWGARLGRGRECQECAYGLEVILHGQRLRQRTMSPWNFRDMLRDRQRLTFLQDGSGRPQPWQEEAIVEPTFKRWQNAPDRVKTNA